MGDVNGDGLFDIFGLTEFYADKSHKMILDLNLRGSSSKERFSHSGPDNYVIW